MPNSRFFWADKELSAGIWICNWSWRPQYLYGVCWNLESAFRDGVVRCQAHALSQTDGSSAIWSFNTGASLLEA